MFKPQELREAIIKCNDLWFSKWLIQHGFYAGKTYVCIGRLPVSSKIADQYLFINQLGQIVKIPYEEGRFEFIDPLP